MPQHRKALFVVGQLKNDRETKQEMYFITDETTEDDVIEHILIRLNTDFKIGCLDVPAFCTREHDKGTYDRTLEMLVREKMYEHDVATRCTGSGQPDTVIMLRPKGVSVYKNGGWKKYLIEFELKKLEKEKRESQPHINITGNAIFGNNNNNNNQSSFERLDIASKNEIKQIPTDTPNKKSNQDIWDKLKSIAQILGFGAALIALITKLMDKW